MGKFSLYNIPLRGLSEGKHEFRYDLDKSFFALIDDGTADVKKGDLKVVVSLKKTSVTFELNFDITGTVHVPCDRCLDDISLDVDTKNKLIVKFGKEYSEESDEIVIIPEEDGEINIAWFLYEFIVLSLPAKKVHPPGTCNKAMSSKLNKHRAKSADDDLDDDSDDDISLDDDDSFTDSRWDGLKDAPVDED
ncbi:YceD family protein [Dysgonomonas termitidis]|uniref:YceD family protein n=1 Tax=Dysgonomonas termitidis TaxID=1516126 RepID=A0ABV9KUZ5_9BACT